MFRKRGGGGGAIVATTDLTMPVMYYTNDGLRDLIVAAWMNGPFSYTNDQGQQINEPNFGDALIDRDRRTNLPSQRAKDAAKAAVNSMAHLELKSVVVITEAEHDDDYTMQDNDEVVFVLPNSSRPIAIPAFGQPVPAALLETAKMLMACTPNGI
jgi:hypothetical protein